MWIWLETIVQSVQMFRRSPKWNRVKKRRKIENDPSQETETSEKCYELHWYRVSFLVFFQSALQFSRIVLLELFDFVSVFTIIRILYQLLHLLLRLPLRCGCFGREGGEDDWATAVWSGEAESSCAAGKSPNFAKRERHRRYRSGDTRAVFRKTKKKDEVIRISGITWINKNTVI